MASCDELNLDGRYKIKRVLSQTPEECFYEGWHVRIEKGSDTKTGQHVSAPSALPADNAGCRSERPSRKYEESLSAGKWRVHPVAGNHYTDAGIYRLQLSD